MSDRRPGCGECDEELPHSRLDLPGLLHASGNDYDIASAKVKGATVEGHGRLTLEKLYEARPVVRVAERGRLNAPETGPQALALTECVNADAGVTLDRLPSTLLSSEAGELRRVDATRPDLRAHRCSFTQNYCAVQPPSTTRTWPVTKLDARDARNTAGPPISSVWPQRPIGVFFTTERANSSSSSIPRVISVSTYPGAKALTCTLCCAHSSARALVRPIRPCLAAT